MVQYQKVPLFFLCVCVFAGLMSLRDGRNVGLRGLYGICEALVAHSELLVFIPVGGTVCMGFFVLCMCFFVVILGENDWSCCCIFPEAPGMAPQHVLNSVIAGADGVSIFSLPSPTASLGQALLTPSSSCLPVRKEWKINPRRKNISVFLLLL